RHQSVLPRAKSPLHLRSGAVHWLDVSHPGNRDGTRHVIRLVREWQIPDAGSAIDGERTHRGTTTLAAAAIPQRGKADSSRDAEAANRPKWQHPWSDPETKAIRQAP